MIPQVSLPNHNPIGLGLGKKSIIQEICNVIHTQISIFNWEKDFKACVKYLSPWIHDFR